MTLSRWIWPVRHGSLLLSALVLSGAAAAGAQAVTSSTPDYALPAESGQSSSQTFQIASNESFGDGMGASSSAQYWGEEPSGGYGRQSRHAKQNNFAFVLGGGFNAPVGNDTPYISWGGNLTIGGGLRFNENLSGLVEYQFMANKLPGDFIYAQGADTGNSHINSITFSPVYDLFPKSTNSVYLVGNGGWYHKSTNFNVVYGYNYWGDPVYFTVASVSSDQIGGGGGFGITHKLGGGYGENRLKIFAEVRYLFLNTPGIEKTNGLGTTGLVPVTFGIRW
jgi:hypothetical protein